MSNVGLISIHYVWNKYLSQVFIMHLIYWHRKDIIFNQEDSLPSPPLSNTPFIVCEAWFYVYYRDLHKAYRNPTPFYYVPIPRHKMVPLSKAASSDTSFACQVTAINGETADVKASWHQSIWVKDFPMGKKVLHYTLSILRTLVLSSCLKIRIWWVLLP